MAVDPQDPREYRVQSGTVGRLEGPDRVLTYYRAGDVIRLTPEQASRYGTQVTPVVPAAQALLIEGNEIAHNTAQSVLVQRDDAVPPVNPDKPGKREKKGKKSPATRPARKPAKASGGA